ncbi:MAG: hypothetical protein ACF8Q5_01680 [Phycisphaerales bacterium JB040]
MCAAEHPCPYCRYDLSGIASSWTDRCPLRGVCSECGTALEWRRVFAHGSSEHRTQPGLTGAGCAARTVLICLLVPVILVLLLMVVTSMA